MFEEIYRLHNSNRQYIDLTYEVLVELLRVLAEKDILTTEEVKRISKPAIDYLKNNKNV